LATIAQQGRFHQPADQEDTAAVPATAELQDAQRTGVALCTELGDLHESRRTVASDRVAKESAIRRSMLTRQAELRMSRAGQQ
jgi:hypothetical protein